MPSQGVGMLSCLDPDLERVLGGGHPAGDLQPPPRPGCLAIEPQKEFARLGPAPVGEPVRCDGKDDEVLGHGHRQRVDRSPQVGDLGVEQDIHASRIEPELEAGA